MEKSAERRVFMTDQLTAQKIDFEICKAVDGNMYDFTNVYNESLALLVNGKNLALAEKGCALSHRIALEKALRENLDYALILEDDVELPSFFKNALEQEIKKRILGETSWDYLAFNYPTVGIKYIRLWLFLYFDTLSRNKNIIQLLKTPFYFIKFLLIAIFSIFEGLRDSLYHKLYEYGKPARFYRPMYLAGCYLITREGVKKILSVSDKIIYAADRVQNIAQTKKKLKLFHFVPLIVKQRRDKFESTMNVNKKYIFNKYD